MKIDQLIGHTRKVGPRTRDPQARSETRDLYVGLGTWDIPPGTLHLEHGTQDLGPYMWDPIWNRDQIPLRGKWDPYINTNLGTLTLIQLSLNMQFSSVAQLFQTGSCTNLFNLTEEQTTQLKSFTFTFKFTLLAFSVHI